MRKEETSVSAIFPIMISLLLLFITHFSFSDAISPWSITIKLEDERIYATPDGTNDSVCSVTGEINCQIPHSYQQVNITLRINASGFDWLCHPDHLIFNRNVSVRDFTAIITVPANTSSGIPIPVTINGTWESESNDLWGNIDSASCFIIVRQYYSASVSRAENITVKAGEKDESKIYLRNEGNGADRIVAEISNLEELAERGWDIQLNEPRFSVPQGKNKIFTGLVSIPFDEKPGIYEIDLIFISSQAESLGELSYLITEKIEVEVLNNYKDELILAGWISSTFFIILSTLVLVFFIIRIKKSNK